MFPSLCRLHAQALCQTFGLRKNTGWEIIEERAELLKSVLCLQKEVLDPVLRRRLLVSRLLWVHLAEGVLNVAATNVCSRISQRGIRETTVELALRHGIRHGEKFVLGKKQIKHLMGEFDQIRKNLCTALDKGGVVVVASDGVLITAYDFDSRKGNY